ncbi:hypothetical protein C121_76 [Stenotrophomonas phage C121]|uniref:hypothetical protein n=1 Tax=Stenotrophomonas phage C121 TaxID=2914029 RepID=UPI0023296769|nr:hypothetical protein PP752_gp76 [Stenotrophomonas phage C121]UKL14809.1 hypothetical protein C121_76 [Stenotrophomonas phage C121]
MDFQWPNGFMQPAGSGGLMGYPTGAGVQMVQQQGYQPNFQMPQTQQVGQGFGLNMNTFRTGLGAINAIGGIYTGLQGLGMARDNLRLQKRAFETNLANTTKAYNTTLEGRARSRAVIEGTSDADTQAYIERNRL